MARTYEGCSSFTPGTYDGTGLGCDGLPYHQGDELEFEAERA